MQTYQIHCSSHKVISHAGTILTPSPSHEHDAMLLHIVPYVTTQLAKQSFITNLYPSVPPAYPPPTLLSPVALLRPPNRDNHLPTFPGNVTTDRPPATQPNPRHFPLRRIRLLRLEIVTAHPLVPEYRLSKSLSLLQSIAYPIVSLPISRVRSPIYQVRRTRE